MKYLFFTACLILLSSTIFCDVEIISIKGNHTPSAIGPYSIGEKILMGDKYMIFASGQIGINPDTGIIVSDDVAIQAAQALENLKNLLESNGSSLDLVIKANIYLTNINDFKAVNDVYASYFKKNLPARSCVEVSKLPKPEAKVEIEVTAFSPANSAEKKFLN